jgi:paraquat-inducible protein B
VDITPDRFSGLDARPIIGQAEQFIDHLVRRGLRAQLQVQSLVTGQLMVDLDFYPEKPAVYSGVEHGVPEMPAIPSDLEVLSKSLKQLPVEEIVTRTLGALEGIQNLVNSPRLPETLTSIQKATKSLETLLAQVNDRLDPMMADAQTMVKEIKGLVAAAHKHMDPMAKNVEELVAETRAMMKTVDETTQSVGEEVKEATVAAKDAFEKAGKALDFENGPPAQIVQSLDETARAARETLAAAEKAMTRVDRVLAEDSPLRVEALRALQDISGAVRSVQVVAEYLQRHPEALLHGKGKAGDR